MLKEQGAYRYFCLVSWLGYVLIMYFCFGVTQCFMIINVVIDALSLLCMYFFIKMETFWCCFGCSRQNVGTWYIINNDKINDVFFSPGKRIIAVRILTVGPYCQNNGHMWNNIFIKKWWRNKCKRSNRSLQMIWTAMTLQKKNWK